MKNDKKIAVVTGGAKGIGRAVAEKFLSKGWSVAVLDVLVDVAKEWIGDNPNAIAIDCDITSTASIQAAADVIFNCCGHVDALVNNAGIIPKGRNYVNGHDEVVLHKIINTNLIGSIHVTQIFGKEMIKVGKGGSIVSLSSISGLTPMSGSLAYGCAKAGIISMAKTVAIEWGRYGIRSNVVCPGQIMSDMTRERFISDPKASQARMEVTPLDRFGEVEDIANAVYFLSSDEASYITGETLLVDGGVTVNMYHVLGKQ